jgi:RNA polymerase sigma-70 factor (ECF subfamily)
MGERIGRTVGKTGAACVSDPRVAASDESLMAAFQTGDVAAFQELMLRHERPLWTFVRRFVADAATAEDLLQEVFLRVVRAAGEWKGDAKVSTWLYTIARNLCTDQARRAVHRKAASLDAAARPADDEPSGASLGDGIPARAAGGEDAAMNRQLGAHIDRAVDTLPVEQREVFLMREVMDLSFSEIARAVGASEPTVKSRMRYALEKLRQALGAFYDAPAAFTFTREGAEP